jgi:hypothetical protein
MRDKLMQGTFSERFHEEIKTGPKPRGKRPGETHETPVLGNPERGKRDAAAQEQTRDSHLSQ